MSQITVSARLPRAFVGAAPTSRSRTRVVNAVPVARGQHGFRVLCVVLVMASFAAVLLLNTARAEGSYVLSSLQAQNTQLHDERVTLQNALAHVESAETLAEAARKLDMVASTSTATLRLSDATITGVASKVEQNRTITVDLPSTGLANTQDD